MVRGNDKLDNSFRLKTVYSVSSENPKNSNNFLITHILSELI